MQGPKPFLKDNQVTPRRLFIFIAVGSAWDGCVVNHSYDSCRHRPLVCFRDTRGRNIGKPRNLEVKRRDGLTALKQNQIVSSEGIDVRQMLAAATRAGWVDDCIIA